MAGFFLWKAVEKSWETLESQGNTPPVRVLVLRLVKIAKTIAPKEIE